MTEKKHQSIKLLLFCAVISSAFLFLCSKNSPFYAFNDWVDANAFFTVGKSMVRGIVPYLELFEQKGPLLYLIYGIGSLISSNTFFGVYLLEVCSWTIGLFFIAKLVALFIDKKYCYVILPLFLALLLTTPAFTHGGSAEEFCLPFLAISLYYLVKHYYHSEGNMSYKILFINGLMAGFVAMIKYTILGFWFGFMLSIIIALWKKKKYWQIIKSSLVFLAGMFLPIGIFFIYFMIHHGLFDFIYQYIIVNITAYPKTHGILLGLILGFGNLLNHMLHNPFVAVMIVIGIYQLFMTDKFFPKKEVRTLLQIIFLCSILGIYGTGLAFRYYFYILTPFSIFGFIYLFQKLQDKKLGYHTKDFCKIIIGVTLISFLILFINPNYSFSKKKKEDLVQYIFADIINETPDATILNYGFLDGGFYTAANVIPNVKYFMKQNISHAKFSEILDGQDNAIRNKEVDYVIVSKNFGRETVYFNMRNIVENYKLIKIEKQIYEQVERTYLLYKLKDI